MRLTRRAQAPYRSGLCYGCAHQNEEISASLLARKWLCGMCRSEVRQFVRWKCVDCGEILPREQTTKVGTTRYMLCAECHAKRPPETRNQLLGRVPFADHHTCFFFDNANTSCAQAAVNRAIDKEQ